MDLPKELIVNYVERRILDMETLKNSLAANQLSEFRRIGHQLAGNASSYGFDDLGIIGRQMEQLSESSLETEGTKLLSRYEVWLEQARSFAATI